MDSTLTPAQTLLNTIAVNERLFFIVENIQGQLFTPDVTWNLTVIEDYIRICPSMCNKSKEALCDLLKCLGTINPRHTLAALNEARIIMEDFADSPLSIVNNTIVHYSDDDERNACDEYDKCDEYIDYNEWE